MISQSVSDRLAVNRFNVDEEMSHICIDQERAQWTGTAGRIIALCPAHVYTKEADGSVSAEYAACLECGTCLAVANAGSLQWVYPRGGMGVSFREG